MFQCRDVGVKAWLANLLLGVTPDQVEDLRKELAVERQLRVRTEDALLKAQRQWADANGERCRLITTCSNLRARLSRCKCRVN